MEGVDGLTWCSCAEFAAGREVFQEQGWAGLSLVPALNKEGILCPQQLFVPAVILERGMCS